MSVFQGPLFEYTSIVVDSFVSRNQNASAFFLSHCHKDHMGGLESSLFAETLRTRKSKGVNLYCSETTKNLITCDYSLSHLADYTVGIPLNEPTPIFLENTTNGSEEKEKVLVTLLSAGHCVGSVMFLFEGKKGNVLYTGDFRLSKNEIEKMPEIHMYTGVKRLRSVYVDTTFCTPSVKTLPSREETAQVIGRIIESWIKKGKNYIVQLVCSARYGYEFIFKRLAIRFNAKIHISPLMYQLYSCLPDMIQHFTLDSAASQIHACTRKKYQKVLSARLHCGLRQIDGKDIHVLKIKPSTMWFVMHGIYPENLTRCLHGLYRVLHSMHASYSEISSLIGYLRPKYVFPTVPPALTCDIVDAYKCLKDLQNDDPDSQESIDSNHNIQKDTRKLGNASATLQKGHFLSTATTKHDHKEKDLKELKEDLFGNYLSSSPPVKRKRKKKEE